MQDFINTLSKEWRDERSQTQMTLRGLIEALKSLPKESLIQNVGYPHSYRGYYSDLSFEMLEGSRTVESLLFLLYDECLGRTFQGYKGGDFNMDENTPIWIADYGRCGGKIIELKDGEVIHFVLREDE